MECDVAAVDHRVTAESARVRGRMRFRDGALSSGAPRSACLSLHVFAQRSIDPCLVALIGCRVALEPGNDISIEPRVSCCLTGR